jgi:hypothetical protein
MGGLWERLTSVFRGSSERRKIEFLMDRRAKLTARRELLYSEIQRLERREKELLEQGRESESNAQKRRLAAQLAGIRKDLERRNTAASVITRNVDVLSTHIHNLELISANREAYRPSAEELNEAAGKVDELLATLKDDADLAAGIEADRATDLLSTEEAGILREFESAREAELASHQLKLDEPAARQAEPPAAEKPTRVEPAIEKPAAEAPRTIESKEPSAPAARREEPRQSTVEAE